MSSPRAAAARAPRPRPAVDIAALAAWSLVLVVTALFRPGLVLEVAVAGLAAASLVPAVRQVRPSPAEGAILLAAFSLPLLNTLPAQLVHQELAAAGSLVPVVITFVPLLALAALLAGREPLTPRPRLLLAALTAGGVALVLSTAVAASAGDALRNAVAVLAVPTLLGIAAVRALRRTEIAQLALVAACVAATVPMVAGIAAFVGTFGVPLTPGDLFDAKRELHRTFLFQEITFGNVAHLASLILIVLPVALSSSFVIRDRTLRIAARVAAAVAAVALILTVSRSALVVGAVALVAVAWQVRSRPRPAALCLAIAATFLLLAVGASVLNDAPPGTTVTGASDPRDPDPLPADIPQAAASSADVRRESIERGFDLIRSHLPFGVGAGQYTAVSTYPVPPHSLSVLVLAELGIPGLLALTATGLFFLLALLGPRAVSTDGRHLETTCSVAALSYLLHGVAFGAPLVTGWANTWPCLLALLAAAVVISWRSP